MNELSEEATAPDAATEAPRPGVPVWRVGKPDSFLAADVATARAAVRSIAGDSEIGAHLGARSEGVRCVTHLFESNKPGYRGWTWFASLARVSRGKSSTVNEVGLLPTEDSVLAPAWVPWAARVRPEDQEEADAAAGTTAQIPAPEENSDGGDGPGADASPVAVEAGADAAAEDADAAEGSAE